MALISCRECGEKISSAAKTCPRCGVDAPANKGGAGNMLRPLLLILGVLVGLTYWLDGSDAPSGAATASVVDKDHLDFERPLYVKEGMPLCPNEKALDNFIALAGDKNNLADIFNSTGCIMSIGVAHVVRNTMHGFLEPYFEVTIDGDHMIQSAWVSKPELTNDAP